MIAPHDGRLAPTIEDPELGTLRWCRRCREWWPLDDEFWYTESTDKRTVRHCRACKADRLVRRGPVLCARCQSVTTRHELCHGCAGRIAGPLTAAKLGEYGLAGVVA